MPELVQASGASVSGDETIAGLLPQRYLGVFLVKKIMVRGAVALAAAALSGLALVGTGVPEAAAKAGHPARTPSAGTVHAAAAPGAQLWVARDNGNGASSVAVSPDGTRVFITGQSVLLNGGNGGYTYVTVAYNAVTGARLWTASYKGSGNGLNQAYSVAVSPNGRRVFVTGESDGSGTSLDYATVAYNAATGSQVWAARYDDPAHQSDSAYSIAVGRDGGRVFVTGTSYTGSGRSYDYATVAYSAATGAKLWAERYNGTANGADGGFAVAVSPAGGAVLVTGTSVETGTGADYTTIAYDPATGAQLWLQHYDGADLGDYARALTVGPAGTVYVTGESQTTAGSGASSNYATVAYSTTGAQLWAARYHGPGTGEDTPTAVAVSPTGNTVFVTGASNGASSGYDYATVAYHTHTGAQLWVNRYSGGGASSVAVSGDGAKVYVTGGSNGAFTGSDYATLAYRTTTGARLWLRRYTGPGDGSDSATSMAVSPTSNKLFVTGISPGWPGGTAGGHATVAYSG